jgi:hypothetical protein
MTAENDCRAYIEAVGALRSLIGRERQFLRVLARYYYLANPEEDEKFYNAGAYDIH